jgi:uncharacterized membrane protein YwaF
MALRRRTTAVVKRWLIGAALFNVGCSTWFTFDLIADPTIDFPLSQNFPLHFCTLMTFLAVPAIWFKFRPLRALVYFPGVLGGFLTLFSPAEVYQGKPILSLTTLFYTVHAFNVIVPVLMASLGIFKPRAHDVWQSIIWFIALAAIILPVTLACRAWIDPGANYFYFFDPEGAGILALLWDKIQVPVLYEAPLLPIALAACYGQYGLYKAGSAIGRKWAGQRPLRKVS